MICGIDILLNYHHIDFMSKVWRTEQVQNHKVKLNKIFLENVNISYSDRIHAKQIVQNIVNTNHLRRCESFVKFALKVADVEL